MNRPVLPRVDTGRAIVGALLAFSPVGCGAAQPTPPMAESPGVVVESPSPGVIQPLAGIEGYGISASGGAGGSICTVGTSAPEGAGSFESCVKRGGNQTIQFAVPQAKVNFAEYVQSNVTIDGCANGQNGVTLEMPADIHRSVILEGPVANVVLRCLRFQGTGKVRPNLLTESDLLGLDGTEGAISRVLVDRCTFTGASDGALDIVGSVSDVTVQRSLFYDNALTMLIKYAGPGGVFGTRISIHHNVYTNNTERNPQIRGDVTSVDFVSNVIHGSVPRTDPEGGGQYEPYGTRLHNSRRGESDGNIRANLRASAWIGTQTQLDILVDPGASAAGIYLSDNYCQPGPCPASPAAAPMAVPSANAIVVTPVVQMKASMLSAVGAPNRTATDQARLGTVAAALP